MDPYIAKLLAPLKDQPAKFSLNNDVKIIYHRTEPEIDLLFSETADETEVYLDIFAQFPLTKIEEVTVDDELYGQLRKMQMHRFKYDEANRKKIIFLVTEVFHCVLYFFK